MHTLNLFWERLCCIQGMWQKKKRKKKKCLRFTWSCAFIVLARKLSIISI